MPSPIIQELCETRETSFQIQGSINSAGRNVVNHTASKEFRVIIDPTSIINPSEVDDVEVGCAAGLPVVNRTSWYSSATGNSMPWAICRNKTVERSSENAYVFMVKCDFETGNIESEECAATPPVNLTDITPQVTAQVGSYERVMYNDVNGNQCWQLPYTKTPYSTPVTQIIPTLQLTITQFESAITFEQMLARSFKLNSSDYRSKAAGLWMTGPVQATDQTVQLSGGEVDAAKVTYNLMLSERYFYPPGVPATAGNETVYGWSHIQPLLDTMKVNAAGDVVPATTNGTGVPVYINASDGKERIPAAIGGDEDRPDYIQHQKQEMIDFNTFLQA